MDIVTLRQRLMNDLGGQFGIAERLPPTGLRVPRCGSLRRQVCKRDPKLPS
jgi:hypothetical protein